VDLLEFLRQLTAHPLVVVVATATLSGYLIPTLVRRAQEQQQAHAIRVMLAKEMSESAAKMLVSVQFAEHVAGIKQEVYDAAYLAWEISRLSIATQIGAQLADQSVAKEWIEISRGISRMYELSGTWSAPHRTKAISDLKAVFRITEDDWQILRDYSRKGASADDFQVFFAAWIALQQSALDRVSALASRLQRSAVNIRGQNT